MSKLLLLSAGLVLAVWPHVANATWDYVPPKEKVAPVVQAPVQPQAPEEPSEQMQAEPRPSELVIVEKKAHEIQWVLPKTCYKAGQRYKSNQEVAKMQMMLAIAGFDSGSFDGIMGAKTENAVKKYQAAMKLPVDGCISEDLYKHIWRTSLHIRGPIMHGKAAVFETQVLLTRLGYYIGDADGIIGGQTRDAIKEFQRANKLKVTGKVDTDLMKKLRSVHAARTDDPYER